MNEIPMRTERVWNEFHDQLLGFIRRRVDDVSVAEDILQDVFMKVHTALPALERGTRLQSWLYQITRNTVIDHYRSRRPHDSLPEALVGLQSEAAETARQELAECLRPMIERLPVHYREALTLSELENLPQREVAERQGISLSGAKSRVQRGRSMIKDLLMECCRFEFDHHGRLVGYESRECSSCDTC